ncbi:MAG: threonine synthase, partial [Promethearchaeota archaeon]
SNLARIVDLYGGIMDHEGNISKPPDMEKLRRDIYSISINDMETRKIILEVHEKFKYILEPHGAVGWGGLVNYLGSISGKTTLPCISIETADPAKFPDLIKEVLEIDPTMPESLKLMQEKKEEYILMENNYETFKSYLVKNF